MATTAASLPRPPRSSFNASQPPTSALPSLPHGLKSKPSTQSLRKTSLLPQTPGRKPSIALRTSGAHRTGTPSLPVPREGVQCAPVPRRAVSIAAFPQPPKNGAGRTSSMPLSPLGAAARRKSREDSPPLGSPIKLTHAEKAGSRLQRPTVSTGSSPGSFSAGGAIVGGGTGVGGAYMSPPQSRSSSAQGSYSTNATTIDGGDEFSTRGRSAEKEGPEKETKGNVIVSVRVRPDAPDAGGDGINNEWMVDSRYGKVGYGGRDGGIYEYDNVFSPQDNNSRVYDSCAKRLVRRVMEGYHGTVFAYGMTGTGKTFSMQGITSSPGVIPLAITDIFSFIRETPHREFLLRVSYLEIYNERIHDLLAAQPGTNGAFVPLDQQAKGEEIKLREDAKRGVYATPLKEEIVQSPTQLLRAIARGDLARRTGSTQFNSRSSRSHAVVQIVVESRDRIPGTTAGGGSMVCDNRRAGIAGGVRVSTLSLIDLAGSERAAENKERRTEGAHINRSLLTLGTVIARLTTVDKDGNGKDKDGNHLPYRDSKLTRLLQPALSGNSLVSILCTIAIPPATVGGGNATNIGETVNTLKFAARARNNIVSHAKKSDESTGGPGDAGSRILLEKYRVEIMELRAELEAQKKKDNEEKKQMEQMEEQERHSEQMIEMQLARTALKERIEHLNRLILCSQSSGVNSARNSGLQGNGHMSSLSLRSSTASLNPYLSRTMSVSTLNHVGILSNSDDESGEFGDGNASLTAQVKSLLADVMDKNRYIATLEKRLLQARRSSQSRTSIGFSPPGSGRFANNTELIHESRVDTLLLEKDEEIAELRARLDDKEKMVAALRSAARKRDFAEMEPRRDQRRSMDVDEGGDGGSGGMNAERASLQVSVSGSGGEDPEEVSF